MNKELSYEFIFGECGTNSVPGIVTFPLPWPPGEPSRLHNILRQSNALADYILNLLSRSDFHMEKGSSLINKVTKNRIRMARNITSKLLENMNCRKMSE